MNLGVLFMKMRRGVGITVPNKQGRGALTPYTVADVQQLDFMTPYLQP